MLSCTGSPPPGRFASGSTTTSPRAARPSAPTSRRWPRPTPAARPASLYCVSSASAALSLPFAAFPRCGLPAFSAFPSLTTAVCERSDGHGGERRLQQAFRDAVHAFNAEHPDADKSGGSSPVVGAAAAAAGGGEGIEFIGFDFHKACSRMRYGNISGLLTECDGLISHCRCFRSAAPPLTRSRRFNRIGEGVSAE